MNIVRAPRAAAVAGLLLVGSLLAGCVSAGATPVPTVRIGPTGSPGDIPGATESTPLESGPIVGSGSIGVSGSGSATGTGSATGGSTSGGVPTASPFPTARPTPRPTPAPLPPAAPGFVGVLGRVTAGPVCPVERIPPDPACAPRAVQGAVIVVADPGGSEVARATSDVNGDFAVSLAPGSYVLTPQPVTGLMGTGQPVAVTVVAGGVVRVTVEYDTGIR